MRVIGGSARGRALKGPPRARAGHRERDSSIRPTSDLIRGVIFDMLDAMGASYERVLDLYAGTGALGIEALSRGDGTADFVERSPEAIAVIRENLVATGFARRATVHAGEVTHTIRRLRGPYTLVLADPPYYDAEALSALATVAGAGVVADNGVLVFEHQRRLTPPERLDGLTLYKSRRHGDAVVSIYEQEDAS